MKKIAFALTLVAIFFASDALRASHVYVENDTPKPMYVGLYRTQKSHSVLAPSGADPKRLSWLILPPGQGEYIPNLSREIGTDRDLWFSYDGRTFKNAVKTKRRSSSVAYKNIGSYVTKVYIGGTGSSMPAAYSSNTEALAAKRYPPYTIQELRALPGGDQLVQRGELEDYVLVTASGYDDDPRGGYYGNI